MLSRNPRRNIFNKLIEFEKAVLGRPFCGWSQQTECGHRVVDGFVCAGVADKTAGIIENRFFADHQILMGAIRMGRLQTKQ